MDALKMLKITKYHKKVLTLEEGGKGATLVNVNTCNGNRKSTWMNKWRCCTTSASTSLGRNQKWKNKACVKWRGDAALLELVQWSDIMPCHVSLKKKLQQFSKSKRHHVSKAPPLPVHPAEELMRAIKKGGKRTEMASVKLTGYLQSEPSR